MKVLWLAGAIALSTVSGILRADTPRDVELDFNSGCQAVTITGLDGCKVEGDAAGSLVCIMKVTGNSSVTSLIGNPLVKHKSGSRNAQMFLSAGNGRSGSSVITVHAACECGDGALVPAPITRTFRATVKDDSVDCELRWSEWTPCSRSCDGGVQERSASVKIEPTYNGQKCPVPLPLEQRTCNTNTCSSLCTFEWSRWSYCSSTCGFGTRRRVANIKSPPGTCNFISDEVQQCSVPCSQDCVQEWTPWGKCSKQCGGGEEVRVKTIRLTEENGGRICDVPLPFQSRPCNTHECLHVNRQSCKDHCGYIRIGPNSCSCDGGCEGEGDCCNDYMLYCGRFKSPNSCADRCHRDALPQQTFTTYGSASSASSGPSSGYTNTGYNTNMRRQANTGFGLLNMMQPQGGMMGGGPQLYAYPVGACQCDKMCTSWGDCCEDYYQECDVISDRLRRQARAPGDFAADITATQRTECFGDQNCTYTEYCDWADNSCYPRPGIGERCDPNQPCQAGLTCEYRTRGSSCEVPCVYGNWTEWSDCGEACFQGVQRRSRKLLSGTNCPIGGLDLSLIGDEYLVGQPARRQAAPVVLPMQEETRTCEDYSYIPPMIAQPPTYTIQQDSGRHEVTLTGIAAAPGAGGGGTAAKVTVSATTTSSRLLQGTVIEYASPSSVAKLSFQVVANQAGSGIVTITVGDGCSNSTTQLFVAVEEVVQDCVLGWTEWSCCSQTCSSGGSVGIRTREQYVMTRPSMGRPLCEMAPMQKQRCGLKTCPVDCKAEWLPWSECSVNCGRGTRTRRVNVLQSPTSDGAACPRFSPQTELCEGPCV